MTFETNGKRFSAHRRISAKAESIRPLGNARAGGILLLFVVLCLIHPQSLLAQAVRGNSGFAANSLERNDDSSTLSGWPLGFSINFFGTTFSTVFVNNNGNVTFNGPLPAFTPEGLTASPVPIIAPFWADVDTRGSLSSVVTYGTDTVNGRAAFGVNYVNVGYFPTHDDKLNRFQLVLIHRSDTGEGNFDIEFNYDRIIWEAGDASGGIGGIAAAVGYSNGTGTAAGSFELSGSRLPGSFLDSSPNGLIHRSAGSTVPGRLVFSVRNGEISCSYTIAPTSTSVGAGVGSGSVGVSAQSGCPWTATSNSSFITITSGSSGNGAGTVGYSVTANSGVPRTGTLTVAGQTFTVVQASSISLNLCPQSFRFTGFVGGGHQRQNLQIGVDGGTLSWQTTVTIFNGTGWLLLSPTTRTSTSNLPSSVIVDVNYGAISEPGTYQAEIAIELAAGGVLARVPITVVVSPAGPQLRLSQTSFLFRAVAGGTASRRP